MDTNPMTPDFEQTQQTNWRRMARARRNLNTQLSNVATVPRGSPPSREYNVRPMRLFDNSSPDVPKSASKTPNVSPLRYLEPVASPSQLASSCRGKLPHYGQTSEIAKPYLRKLLQICTDTSMKCENPKDIMDHLRMKYRRNHENFALVIEESQSKFEQLFQYWLSLSGTQKQKMLRGLLTDSDGLPRFSMQIANKYDRGEGVVRSTFTEAIDDMLSSMFMPADNDPKANRLVLRPAVDEERCKFAGEFLAFCLLNELPIPRSLSRSILIRCIYKESEFDPDMDVMYAITDYTETSQLITNELSFPEYMDMDDMKASMRGWSPKASSPKRSKAMDGMTFETHPHEFYEMVKDYERKRVKSLIKSPALTALVQGFFLRNEARRHTWTVDRLDQLLSGSAVNVASCSQLLQYLKLHRTPSVFVDMLENLVRAQKFVVVEKIMQYWSGLKKIDMQLLPPYQVIEIDKGLPMASTCFNQLKIPRDVKSADMLLERFRIAIENSGTSFGLD